MFYGWWIVGVVFLTAMFGGATVWYGFTAYFDPLIEEFGWSYTAISVAASLRGAELGLLDVVVGFLVDRFSNRQIVFGGSILIGIGFLLLSRVNSLTTFYLSFFIIFVGAAGIGSVVFFAIITRWFRKQLGLALGLATAGFGAAGLAVPGIVYLLDLVGLRMAFVIFGITAFIIGGLAAYIVRNRPEDIGCAPDGVPLDKSEDMSEHANTHTSDTRVASRDYTFKEAIANPAFWIVVYVSVVSTFSLMMITTHVMPYLQHIGYSRYMASIVAMMIPVISIAGRLGIGWVSDFIGHKVLLMLMAVGEFAGVALFLYAHLPFLLILFVLLFGVSYGGINVLRLRILRDHYGGTYIGSLIGLCLGASAGGGIVGPLLAGWVFDTTGRYILAWLVSTGLLLISIPLVSIMKHPQAMREL
jgi:sugar phosphate permease